MISLGCRPSDSLVWDTKALPSEGPLFFRLDLGLECPFFPIDDEMHFQSLALGLTRFSEEIWPVFQERISGVVLYRGSADFSATFSWTEKQRMNWDFWKEEQPKSQEDHMKRLFCADAFVHYFQMLAHKLPDEMPLYLLLDGTGIGSLAERHQLLSRERFEHFLIATKGLPFSNGLLWEGEGIQKVEEKSSRALCFPEGKRCSKDVLQRLEKMMAEMNSSFRVIPEAFLTEEWEGVDVLHVLKETLTVQGERKLKGFLATGGSVILK